jgi:hypothetical protein
MPEATIDEHGDAKTNESDVSDPARLGQDRDLDPVSEAEGMKRSPERGFGSGVPLSNALHSAARFERGGRDAPEYCAHVSDPAPSATTARHV